MIPEIFGFFKDIMTTGIMCTNHELYTLDRYDHFNTMKCSKCGHTERIWNNDCSHYES